MICIDIFGGGGLAQGRDLQQRHRGHAVAGDTQIMHRDIRIAPGVAPLGPRTGIQTQRAAIEPVRHRGHKDDAIRIGDKDAIFGALP